MKTLGSIKNITAALMVTSSLWLTASLALAEEAFQPNPTLLDGIALLSSAKRTKQGYQALERSFVKEKDEYSKVQTATLLSFASNRDLLLSKRYLYAQYAIDHGSEYIPTKIKATLLRVAGDGFFDQADLNQAEKYYQKLAQSSDQSSAEYAEYKIGWIELNRSEAHKAFSRWSARLAQKCSACSSMPDLESLRSTMLRDLGRAWGETNPIITEQAKVVNSLPMIEEYTDLFIDGLVLGVRRVSDKDQLKEFGLQAAKTKFVKPLFDRLMENNFSFQGNACWVADWLADSALNLSVEKENPKVLLGQLSRCLKWTIESDQKNWKSQDITKQIVEVLAKIKAQGQDRWAKAEMLRQIGDNKLSCLEYIAMGNEMGQQKTLMPSDASDAMHVTCNQLLGSDESISKQFYELVAVLSTQSLLKNDPRLPIYDLVNRAYVQNSFKNKIIDLALNQTAAVMQTALPQLIATHLTDAGEREKIGPALLERFAPKPLSLEKPIDQIWLEIVRISLVKLNKSNDSLTAKAQLEAYLPHSLNRSDEMQRKVLELWSLWAVAAPIENESIKLTVTQLEKTLATSKLTRQSEMLEGSLLALAMKTKSYELIWKNAADLLTKSAQRHPELCSLLYQTTFEMLLSHTINAAIVQSSNLGSRLVEIAKAVQKATIAQVNQKELLAQMGLGLPQAPVFLKDLKKIEELNQLNLEIAKNKQLRIDTKIASRIENALAKVKNLIGSATSYGWSHAQFAKVARHIAYDSCGKTIDWLKNIKKPSGLTEEQIQGLQNQLQSVIAGIQAWQKPLMEVSQK